MLFDAKANLAHSLNTMFAKFGGVGGRGIQGVWGDVIAILVIGLGLATTLGIWIPRFRWRWARTRVSCGVISTLSLALFLFSLGFGCCYSKTHSLSSAPWFVAYLATVWLVGSVGYIVDSRTGTEVRPKYTLPNAPQKQRLHEWRGWVCFVGGVIVLIWALCGFNSL